MRLTWQHINKFLPVKELTSSGKTHSGGMPTLRKRILIIKPVLHMNNACSAYDPNVLRWFLYNSAIHPNRSCHVRCWQPVQTPWAPEEWLCKCRHSPHTPLLVPLFLSYMQIINNLLISHLPFKLFGAWWGTQGTSHTAPGGQGGHWHSLLGRPCNNNMCKVASQHVFASGWLSV